jgi:hypothetical protein
MKIPTTNKRKSKPVKSHESSKRATPTKSVDLRPSGQKMQHKSDRGSFSVNDWRDKSGHGAPYGGK